jgi:hypothetical protein
VELGRLAVGWATELRNGAEGRVTIDMAAEEREVRAWANDRVATTVAASGGGVTVEAVVAMFCYVQDGWVALDFDSSPNFEFDGDVSAGAWSALLPRPHWQVFAEAEGAEPLTFLGTDGPVTLPAAGITDEFLAGGFGRLVVEALSSAWRDGAFAPLRLQPGCLWVVADFYGNWQWEAVEQSGRLVVRPSA